MYAVAWTLKPGFLVAGLANVLDGAHLFMITGEYLVRSCEQDWFVLRFWNDGCVVEEL